MPDNKTYNFTTEFERELHRILIYQIKHGNSVDKRLAYAMLESFENYKLKQHAGKQNNVG